MFIPHRVDVTEKLLHEDINSLNIVFESALLKAREIKDEIGDTHRWVGFNGEMSRLAVRKAQYHWYIPSLSGQNASLETDDRTGAGIGVRSS